MHTALITGSAGLVGSEAALFFADQGYDIVGIDNDMRSYFFGSAGSTAWRRRHVEETLGRRYTHYAVDIRDQGALQEVFQRHRFNVIIHAAAQPSHDWAAREPVTDFDVNARATLLLLESYRQFCPEATFLFMSTNKVYGDHPNALPVIAGETRYELPEDHPQYPGIDESMSIDQNLHSFLGVSKVAADVMVQEYARYFGLPTGIFRGGCLTGPAHSGAPLHGFLSYLVACIAQDRPYTIHGYEGKQVRDNLHSRDLVRMFWEFHRAPRPGEVYNVGGGRFSNTSLLEAVQKTKEILGKKARMSYDETPRKGDHIWYISNTQKFQNHYPEWRYEHSMDDILEELCRSGHR